MGNSIPRGGAIVSTALLRLAAVVALGGATSSLHGAETVAFEKGVAPVFITKCLECHGELTASGGLVLSSADRIHKGGENGPAIAPGKPSDSYLMQRVESGEMPPAKHGKTQKLSDAEIAAIKTWIADGAPWPTNRKLDLYEKTTAVRAGRDWWSLQPIRRPKVPTLNPPNPDANPIDAFLLQKLNAEGMKPAPQADRSTLVRRLYFDLLGLPPSEEEIQQFLQDSAPYAYERLATRLLSSPHFGERWARYWLDLVRFAESSGYERDQEKPGAWKYRDWVIRAVNEDKPYDQFIVDQLAGDETPDCSEASAIATGFLRLGTWNDEPNDPQEYKYERLEDMVHATSTAFLGLTVKCARCHDHKFDPIPQTDYYRLAAAFWAGPIEPRGSDLLGGPAKKELAYDVLGWTDLTRDPPPLRLLKKGEPRLPGPVVGAGALSLIPTLDRPFDPAPAAAKTSQRRLQLARWIVDPRNPLTARVYVNRLWQHHFGQGLVRTPDNFGFMGQKPTHPELLDWLADEFIRGGWSAKRMHFLVVTSETYKQASVHPDGEAYSKKDFGNKLWWRAERRRRDAESLRDAMLTASGELQRTVGGPSFKSVVSTEALEGLSKKAGAWQASPADQQCRRSVYMFTQRSLLPPLMTTFDFCDTMQPCARRDESIVAPQALALLNGEFAHQRSQALSKRVQSQAGNDPAAQTRRAWGLALGREPNAQELAAAREHLDKQRQNFKSQPHCDAMALASLCHVLLNCNEFIYVD